MATQDDKQDGEKKKVGELLVRETAMSATQLKRAQKARKDPDGGRLGMYLTKQGVIDEGELSSFLSKQYGVPSINLNEFEIEEEVIRLIPREVADKHQVVPVFSLDREISNTDGRRYIDMLADERSRNPFDDTMLRAWNKSMDDVLEVLTPMERTILRWRFGLDSEGEGMTLKEIGDHYNLSRERIRQLQEQALRKIREHLDLDAA